MDHAEGSGLELTVVGKKRKNPFRIFVVNGWPGHRPFIEHPFQIRGRHDTLLLSLSKLFLLPERAVPHSKAQLAGFGATPQLMYLTLSGPSLRRKRHESVMRPNTTLHALTRISIKKSVC